MRSGRPGAGPLGRPPESGTRVCSPEALGSPKVSVMFLRKSLLLLSLSASGTARPESGDRRHLEGESLGIGPRPATRGLPFLPDGIVPCAPPTCQHVSFNILHVE